jgi:putative ABC transport system permease protein
VLLSIVGVAVAVGLMVAVTGVSLGLASQSVVQSEGVDYWVVPEQSTVSTIAVSTGGVQLGNVHETAARITADERVDHATPVLLELLPVADRETGEREYILAVGIVPDASSKTFAGLSTRGLTPGDPYYANGSYDGRWTGEAVLNDGAATLLNASTGESVTVARTGANRSFLVRNVTGGAFGSGIGSAPVMLVHLSELQAMTGGANGDQADQILVSTNDPSVRSELEGVYPETSVVARQGLSSQSVSTSSLALAVAVAAFAAAVVVGVLFVATLMGLEVSADRQQLGVLAALGYTGRSRSLLVATETVVVSILGGVLGIPLGVLGTVAVNRFIAPQFGVESVGVFEPVLAVYALVVAVLIGLLGSLYPVFLSSRTNVLEVLSQ